jgi:hypothetical protein
VNQQDIAVVDGENRDREVNRFVKVRHARFTVQCVVSGVNPRSAGSRTGTVDTGNARGRIQPSPYSTLSGSGKD